LTVECIWVTRQ